MVKNSIHLKRLDVFSFGSFNATLVKFQICSFIVDKILFESYFPIIFTCINDNKDIFIGVCCQNNEKGCKWLLGKTDGISIAGMLQDEMTIRQLLLEHSEGKISVDYAEKAGYVVAYNNSDWDVDSSYLPKKDSYMYAEEGEFENEIKYFSSLNDCASYNKEYYKCALETLGTISKEIELLTLLTAQPDTDSVVLPPFNINKMFKN